MNPARQERGKAPLRVYLSHSTDDTVFARKLRNLLVRRLNWRTFTSEELSAGEHWQSRMRSELSESDLILALLTPRLVESNWVLHELGAAWALEKPIVAVITRRDVLNALPAPVHLAQTIELQDLENEESIEQFLKNLQGILTVASVRN